MKNTIKYVAAIMLLMGFALSARAQDYSGTYQIMAKIGSGLALDVQGSDKTLDGIQVVINNGDKNAASQQWRFERQSDGTYTITNVRSNRLMDVTGSSKSTRANVIQSGKNGGASQRWRIAAARDTDYVKITNVNSGMVLDVYNNETRVDTRLIQFTDRNDNNQQFKLIRLNEPGDYSGTYQIIPKIGNGLALDVQGSDKTLDGIQVVINNGDKNAASQQWRFERQSDGTYTITNVRSNRLLDVTGSSKNTRANVIQSGNNGGASQRWRITAARDADYVKITNVNSGMVLDVYNNETRVDTRLIQFTDRNDNNQQFKLVN